MKGFILETQKIGLSSMDSMDSSQNQKHASLDLYNLDFFFLEKYYMVDL